MVQLQFCYDPFALHGQSNQLLLGESYTLRFSEIYREDLILTFLPASSVVKVKIIPLQESIHYVLHLNLLFYP